MSIVHVTFYPSTRNFVCKRCSNIFRWNQSLKGVWTFHYTLRSRLIVLPRSLCYLPSPRKHRTPENPSKIPTESMKAFHSTYFFFFSMFQWFFFTETVVHLLNISDQRLQNGRFIFLKNRFFKVAAGDSPASKLSYLGGRSEPRENTWASGEAARCRFPVPRFRVFSRVPLARLLFTIGGGCGLWARNIAHRTCRKLCVLPTLKQNSVHNNATTMFTTLGKSLLKVYSSEALRRWKWKRWLHWAQFPKRVYKKG